MYFLVPFLWLRKDLLNFLKHSSFDIVLHLLIILFPLNINLINCRLNLDTLISYVQTQFLSSESWDHIYNYSRLLSTDSFSSLLARVAYSPSFWNSFQSIILCHLPDQTYWIASFSTYSLDICHPCSYLLGFCWWTEYGQGFSPNYQIKLLI